MREGTAGRIFEKRKLRILLIAALLLVQSLVTVYWQGRKAGFDVNELFSFADARSFAVTEGKKEAKFKFPTQTWLEIAEYREKMTVTPETGVQSMSFPGAARAFLTGRNYMGLLSLSESLFSPGEISRFPGYALNLVFFLLLQIVFYLFVRRLGLHFPSALLCLTVFGFSAAAISMTEYTWFYIWTELLVLTAFLLHVRMWTEQRTGHFLLGAAAAFFLLYLGFRNSELVLLIGGFLFVGFSAGMALRKKGLFAALYFFPAAGIGTWYLAEKTSFISMLLDLPAFLESGGQKERVAENLTGLTPGSFLEGLGEVLEGISRFLLNGGWMLAAFLIFAAVLLGLRLRLGKQGETAPRRRQSRFWILPAGTAAAFLLFCAAAGLIRHRYHFLVYPLLLGPAFLALQNGICALGEGKTARRAAASLAALALIGSLMPFFTRDMMYIYEREQEVWESAAQYAGCDNIVLYRSGVALRSRYETVARSDASSRMYVMNQTRHRIDTKDCTDTMLLWAHQDLEITDEMIQDLTKGGYTIRPLGTSHLTALYVCERTN